MRAPLGAPAEGNKQGESQPVAVPWVLQVDVNPSAVARAHLLSTPALQLLQWLLARGYARRVYHWGPACQQRVRAEKRLRGNDDEARAWWCRVDTPGSDAGALAAALRRIPARRTEHFVLVHNDVERLSTPYVGALATEWETLMDGLSLV